MMNYLNYILLITIFFLSQSIYPQENKKVYKIPLTSKQPKIDGKIDEDVWQQAPVATDFVMYSPDLGKKEPDKYATKVRMLYDNEAVYVAAMMKDPHPEDIPRQFSTRDNYAQADYFKLTLNPFNDARNDVFFVVLSSGVQVDAKIINDDVDKTWNSVWQSAVFFDENAWYVEMKIPYSALRFPGTEVQEWGVNFMRFRQNTKEKYVWNFIDRKNGKNSEYSGILKGIRGIKPPVRLSFYPYALASLEYYDGELSFDKTGGMDLKYGITDSFTLDATLIPDFSQTAFDEEILNWGPFEHQYEEKRAFFTEGMELFSKGDLFYSRRIGGTPLLYDEVEYMLDENEIVVDNPERNRMYNAIKLTGRTNGGLGIGVFNALTENTYATILNTESNEEREILTNPMTNYSVLVLDQSLPRASYISFVTTNVIRGKDYGDANVSSLLYKYRTPNKKYILKSDISMSNIHSRGGGDAYQWKTGWNGNISFKEATGSHRFGLKLELMDTDYDKNDLGIMDYNNFVNYEIFHSYRIFSSLENLIQFKWRNYAYLEYRFSPYSYADNGIGTQFFATTKKFLSFGGGLESHFGHQNDYYEPRGLKEVYTRPQPQFVNAWISTDYRKRAAVDIRVMEGVHLFENDGYAFHNLSVSPRFRFSNRVQLNYDFSFLYINRDIGYFMNDSQENMVIFGNRDINNIVNSLKFNYYPGIKSSLSLVFRHNWTKLMFDKYYELMDDGSLSELSWNDTYTINANYWNLDFSYSWEFAPGSQLVALYRNLIKVRNTDNIDYFTNMRQMWDNHFVNNLSVKFIYYLDYNSLKSISK